MIQLNIFIKCVRRSHASYRISFFKVSFLGRAGGSGNLKFSFCVRRVIVSDSGEIRRSLTVKEKLARRASRVNRAATARSDRIWEYGVIPYEIDGNFSGNLLPDLFIDMYFT